MTVGLVVVCMGGGVVPPVRGIISYEGDVPAIISVFTCVNLHATVNKTIFDKMNRNTSTFLNS